MTVETMLRLIAGVFVAASVLLGMYVHPYFLWFTLFVGLNLAQSSFSGWCPIVAAGAPYPPYFCPGHRVSIGTVASAVIFRSAQ